MHKRKFIGKQTSRKQTNFSINTKPQPHIEEPIGEYLTESMLIAMQSFNSFRTSKRLFRFINLGYSGDSVNYKKIPTEILIKKYIQKMTWVKL